MTQTYFIKIIPERNFFFGKGDKNETNAFGNSNCYFLESLLFPQQTAILGLLRHTLLLQNNLLSTIEDGISQAKQADAIILIGEKSFNGTQTKFGCIESISPVFISNQQNEHFFYRNSELTTPIYENTLKEIHFAPGNNSVLLDASSASKMNPLNQFEYKDPFQELFIKENGEYAFAMDKYKKINDCEKETVEWSSYKNVFSSSERVGIRKGKNGKTEDEAYYKQNFLRFESDFCYGIYVTLDDDKLKEGSFITTFGKERSVFKLEIKKQNSSDINSVVYGNNSLSKKALLLSDCIVNANYLDAIDIAITNLGGFANLKTNTNNDSYARNAFFEKNNQQYVLKRGSVLFIKDKSKWDKAITNLPFQNIGMNQFTYIKELFENQINPIKK